MESSDVSEASLNDHDTGPGRKPTPRTEPAPALVRLVEAGRIDPSKHILCYGCGHGADVTWLRLRKFDVRGYDPHPPFGYFEPPSGKFDVVFVIYLMTRLKTDANRRANLARAANHLRPGGQLVVITRHWAQLAQESGGEGLEGAHAYFARLLDELGLDGMDAEPGPPDDPALSIFARKGGIYKPRLAVSWIDDTDEAARICAALQNEAQVGLDVETTLEEPRKLCTIQLAAPGHVWIVDALALTDYGPMKALMENPAVEKIIHNATFEEQMFAKHGIRIHNVYDTLPVSRKKHRKGASGGHKLGEVCERELGIYLDKRLQTSDWTQRPLSPDQLDYAAVDAEVLLDLYQVFNPPKPPENLTLF
jgi:hypothetical protein